MNERIVGIGEILWDIFDGERRLGGAPANFACDARGLGGDAVIITSVGDDPPGREILAELDGRGFDIATIATATAHPTGTVTVATASDGQPSYTIHEEVAWDYLAPGPAAIEAVANADAICFGSLAQRNAVTREAIRSLLRSARPGALRVFDVNLRQQFYSEELLLDSLELANALKLNDEELPIIAGLIDCGEASPRAALRALARAFSLDAIALTRGADGSILFASGDRWSETAGIPVKARDTVGAGDAFLAGFVIGLLRGMPLDDINRHANTLARHVCLCPGATPPIPDAIRMLFEPAIQSTEK